MSLAMRLLRAVVQDRPALADRRPWEVGEPASILSCNRRTGRPTGVPGDRTVFRCSVAAYDGQLVTVVVASGRKATHEMFWADTGWDAYQPGECTPWRLFHGYVRE